MERPSKSEITALLALVSLTAGALLSTQSAQAQKANSKKTMLIAEKTAGASKGKDSSCGKGSCGTDDKGAAAAKKAHAASGKTSDKTVTTSKSKTAASDKSAASK